MRCLADQEAYLEKRKDELGIDPERFFAARNSGVTRTASKQRLLQAIADEAQAQGREVPFVAS